MAGGKNKELLEFMIEIILSYSNIFCDKKLFKNSYSKKHT
jgi:hypothetical protein